MSRAFRKKVVFGFEVRAQQCLHPRLQFGIAVARAGLLTGTCVSSGNSYASAPNTAGR